MDINHFIQQLVILAPPFLFALTFHELAHGYVAWHLGDPTAKNAGRLTMNPLKHLDPLLNPMSRLPQIRRRKKMEPDMKICVENIDTFDAIFPQKSRKGRKGEMRLC